MFVRCLYARVCSVGPQILRICTWGCIGALAILSLLPAEEMVRTGIGGHIEHFIAYGGSAGIAILGYGRRYPLGAMVAGFILYAGLLECLQTFSPGRHPAFADFVASSLGALCGALVAAAISRLSEARKR